jgi:NADH-quinone oxidoreductase subunit M
LIGIIISSSSLYRMYDLKKLIALSSIIHLNASMIGLINLSTIGLLASIISSLAHSFSSIAMFYYIGLIITRSNNRFIDSLCWLTYSMRMLLLLIILANVAFPLSLNFIGELMLLIQEYINC